MRDRDIVGAIVAGDPTGLAAAFDAYAASLHACCRTLLAEPEDAADAVQDTFVIAAARAVAVDLADTLGVPVDQAHALVSRARGQLERSLSALLLARTGRSRCAELDAILGN